MLFKHNQVIDVRFYLDCLTLQTKLNYALFAISFAAYDEICLPDLGDISLLLTSSKLYLTMIMMVMMSTQLSMRFGYTERGEEKA